MTRVLNGLYELWWVKAPCVAGLAGHRPCSGMFTPQAGLSLLFFLESEVTHPRSRDQVNTVGSVSKDSGHQAIHLTRTPTARWPQQRPASSQQRLVARRRVAPPLALFTASLIKVTARVSAADRGAGETRGWEKDIEIWPKSKEELVQRTDTVYLYLGLETTCRYTVS